MAEVNFITGQTHKLRYSAQRIVTQGETRMNIDDILIKDGKDWTDKEVAYINALLKKETLTREQLKIRREELRGV